MKALFLLTALWLNHADCNRKPAAVKYQGRLEITGICMNYTIRLLDDHPESRLAEDNWTDEVTGINYQHVFRLGNPCDFPAGLKKGDSFYFTIDTTPQKPCTVCLAYYPTPSKSLSIKVIE